MELDKQLLRLEPKIRKYLLVSADSIYRELSSCDIENAPYEP